jgi:hypothetical protein
LRPWPEWIDGRAAEHYCKPRWDLCEHALVPLESAAEQDLCASVALADRDAKIAQRPLPNSIVKIM